MRISSLDIICIRQTPGEILYLGTTNIGYEMGKSKFDFLPGRMQNCNEQESIKKGCLVGSLFLLLRNFFLFHSVIVIHESLDANTETKRGEII